MSILINPETRWAVHPSDVGSIEYIDGLWDGTIPLPQVNDVLTLAFMVDPSTKQPVPVRVSQIVEIRETRGHTLAVVVTRADRYQ